MCLSSARVCHQRGRTPRHAVAIDLVSEIQQLLTGEQADPRAAQGVFLIPVVVELAAPRSCPGWHSTPTSSTARIVALVPTLGSVAIGRGWLAGRWTILLPVLDIVALGIYRLSDGTAIGIAVAFPAIWLGSSSVARGSAVTVVTCWRVRAADPDQLRLHPRTPSRASRS